MLDALWRMTKKLTPRGDIGHYTDEEIEKWIGWNRETPKPLMEILHDCRFLDRHEDPAIRWVIHDWPEHCEEYVHIKVARMRERFIDGTYPHTGDLSQYQRAKFYEKFPEARPTTEPPSPNVRPFPSTSDRQRPRQPRQSRSGNPDVPNSLAALLEKERWG